MNNVPINTIKPAVNNIIERELSNLREAGAVVQRIRLRAQHELEQAVKTRAESEQYLNNIQARANSHTQRLLLGARLVMKKEIEGIKLKAIEELRKEKEEIRRMALESLQQEMDDFRRKLNEELGKISESLQQEIDDFRRKLDEELGKVLADIRVIRIAAHEELKVQRKLADAAKIQALSFELQESDKQSSRHFEETIKS